MNQASKWEPGIASHHRATRRPGRVRMPGVFAAWCMRLRALVCRWQWPCDDRVYDQRKQRLSARPRLVSAGELMAFAAPSTAKGVARVKCQHLARTHNHFPAPSDHKPTICLDAPSRRPPLSLQPSQGKGPIIDNPIRTMEQVKQVTKLNAEESCPFVGESLRILRQEVGNQSTVLGFVGAPFTLATYIIEGGSSKSFAHTKRMAFGNPEVRGRWAPLTAAPPSALIPPGDRGAGLLC